ncbi:hypothetical protein EJ02DRAFT_459881 [Clathrospora elynae]|uniref:Uncharacterized protein n=1 Tax=Clathrospora elynae TaxID=706981 RepID=A0A6A5S7I0_9PLEO|nr:hypothetical protein EJ02DRAFT_459881 [Clathrospora elynae]
MFGFKLLAVATLALAVVAAESCAPAVIVTVTITDCISNPGIPAPTSSGYAPLPPASSVESTATAPLSNGSPGAPTTVAVPPPGPPVPSSEGSAPPASGTQAISSIGAPEGLSSGVAGSSTGFAGPPSTTAANVHPSSSDLAPPAVTTNAAALATPFIGLVALGAAALAVIVT